MIFITGHSREGNWRSLAQYNHTQVIYIGPKNLPFIRDRLLANQLAADTPVVLIENATRPNARVIITTLADCMQARDENQLKPPTLIIIGQVVSLHTKLSHDV